MLTAAFAAGTISEKALEKEFLAFTLLNGADAYHALFPLFPLNGYNG